MFGWLVGWLVSWLVGWLAGWLVACLLACLFFLLSGLLVSSLIDQMDCLLFVGCLTSQQHASVSQGRICSDNCTCCHTEIEVADQTFHLTQPLYIDTEPTSPSTDPIMPGAWQGSHWSANFEVTGMTRPWNNPGASGIRTWDLPLSRRTPEPLGQRGGRSDGIGALSKMTSKQCLPTSRQIY